MYNTSTVLSLLSKKNPLQAQFFPPLEGKLEIGLLSLHGRHVVPNVTEANNVFYYGTDKYLEVIPSYYNLDELTHSINNHLMGKHRDVYEKLTEAQRKLLGYSLIRIGWNPSLERVEVFCAFPIKAHGDHSLMAALGFDDDTLMALRVNIAEREMRFYQDNIIRVNCYDVHGDYQNGERSRTIYEFDCNHRPGERYEEKPNVVTYFPVCDRTSLREVRLELCDRQNRPLNLLHELTLVRLHIRYASGI